MTFEALENNVMLVELSCDDMKKYKITYETLHKDNKYTENAVRDILKTIKASDYFNTKEKIIVEALPTDNGGCFFIFTFSSKIRYKMKRLDAVTVFKVSALDDLLDLITVLKSQGLLTGSCEIFKYKHGFFIEITRCSEKLRAILWEFGVVSKIDGELLREYGINMGRL